MHAQLIGQSIVHGGPFRFSGESVRLEIPGHENNTDVSLRILDEDGVEVRSVPLSRDQEVVTWDGSTTEGQYALVGNYSAELRSNIDDALVEQQVFASSQVEEVQLKDGSVNLVLASGSMVSRNDVVAIRTGQ